MTDIKSGPQPPRGGEKVLFPALVVPPRPRDGAVCWEGKTAAKWPAPLMDRALTARRAS